MTLQEYYDALKAHDWQYQYSDDGSVYRRGEAEERRLRVARDTSSRHLSLWTRFNAWAQGTQKKIPARPK